MQDPKPRFIQRVGTGLGNFSISPGIYVDNIPVGGYSNCR